MKTINLRNLIVTLSFLLLSIGLQSFIFKPGCSILKTNIETAKVKFVLRWHGLESLPPCSCPGCLCSACPCPLGICFCKTVGLATQGGDWGNDVGTADAWFDEEGKLHLKFDQITAINEPSISSVDVVPVSGNTYFSEEAASHFGFSTVMIPAGYYVINYTNNTYGEIIITPTTTPL